MILFPVFVVSIKEIEKSSVKHAKPFLASIQVFSLNGRVGVTLLLEKLRDILSPYDLIKYLKYLKLSNQTFLLDNLIK